MAFEVAQELVVVGGEVANCIVAFGRGIDDGLGVVGEACEMSTVFLTQ